MSRFVFLCRASCRATLRNMSRDVAATSEVYLIAFSVLQNLLFINFSSNRQYCPIWFYVTYRVARHCITCQNLLIINFSLKHALFLEMCYCRARALCRPTPRPCSYNFKTCSIVYSVCQNLLIINVSSNHALFLEIYLVRASCRATLQL